MKLTLLKLVEIFWLAETAVGVNPAWGAEVSDVPPVRAVDDGVWVGGEVEFIAGAEVLMPACVICPVAGGYLVRTEADDSVSPVFFDLRAAVAWAYRAGR